MYKFKRAFITLPTAIVIAAAMISIAIIWATRPATKTDVANTNPNNTTATQADKINIRAVTSTDHILGNPNAPIKIVEYSDPSCPYCKVFAPTIEKIMDTYGSNGTVAWVYRSFPLDKPDEYGRILHKNAGHESQAMECAADLGGNDKYWVFLKRLYEVTPSVTPQTPNGLDQDQLPIIAKFAGLDVKAFNECLSSERFKDKVNADYLDGINGGINGTPYNVFVLSKPAPKTLDPIITTIISQLRLPSGLLFISSDRTKIAMSGAMPYETMKTVIDTLLAD